MLSVYLRTIGCSKNQVDSELMRGVLHKEQFSITENPALADIIIVNTCGFIESAKMESIEAILELAEYRKNGNCILLLAVGCMAEKYAAEMAESMPELDGLMGVGHYEDIGDLINEKLGRHRTARLELDKNVYLERDYSVLGATAYLKIAEGCDNNCSFCLIPQLRGGYKSREMADIVEEANNLYRAGVKELVLLAQNTTYYGIDIYGEGKLPDLLKELAKIPFTMIRLLYAYPEGITDELVQVIKNSKNICHYLDMPVQHGVDHILAAMNRPDTGKGILERISLLRQEIPDIVLRTTIMVGFPGETDEDFDSLLEFMKQADFDWVGAFPYYQEEDTPAALLPQQVDEDIKQQRFDLIMDYTAQITDRKLKRFVGQVLPVLVCESASDIYGEDWYAGRSQYQAPDVDGLVYFYAPKATIGDIIDIKINSSDMYDLKGELA